MRHILLRSLAIVALVGAGVSALPAPAHAWWRGGVFVGVTPFYVRPAPLYAAPPVYYAPPPPVYYRRAWVPPHWGPYGWVPGHWR